ncbi:MAG: hypothetical protein P8184_01950 [Calditrichia bacterium]
MTRKIGFKYLILFVLGAFIFIYLGCNTGVESSPTPGILRITLESDPADTSIIIVTDTLHVSDKDGFRIKVYQGKVYHDTAYATLYPTLASNSQEELYYNLIVRENNQYSKFTIFESYVPPQKYDEVQFGIDSDYLKLKNFDMISVETPTNYFVNLKHDFEVFENKVTEVNIRVSPFKSVSRYKDKYIFEPQMQIADVKYY